MQIVNTQLKGVHQLIGYDLNMIIYRHISQHNKNINHAYSHKCIIIVRLRRNVRKWVRLESL